MPIITWEHAYTVDVDRIDNQHKRLVEMINKAYDHAETMEEGEVLHDLLDDLRDYTLHHFGTEEAMMKGSGYPEEALHLEEHDHFREKMAGTELDPIDIFKFLADWLRTHIQGTDKRFADYLIEKGLY
ncbi:bacteriohemerythrin [Pseudodesulfovibrio sp.]|nr:bacteriohemerythrin [Pseudodesulfovibrio sp.]